MDSGRRLLTIEEAAKILRVRERAVHDWIDAGMISYVTVASGERRIQQLAEHENGSQGINSSQRTLALGQDIDRDTQTKFRKDLQRRQRELQLESVDYGSVNIQALTSLIAARFAAVVPDPTTVTAADGQIFAAGRGIDIAHIIAHADGPPHDRIRYAAGQALDTLSGSMAEITTEPWPARTNQFRGGFPPSNATLADGKLLLSYGDESDPTLTLEPIRLADVIN
jgi:excisionase family DNA binding protein